MARYGKIGSSALEKLYFGQTFGMVNVEVRYGAHIKMRRYFCSKYEIGIFVALIVLRWLHIWLKKVGFGKVWQGRL